LYSSFTIFEDVSSDVLAFNSESIAPGEIIVVRI
jgi:hypothetical protein